MVRMKSCAVGNLFPHVKSLWAFLVPGVEIHSSWICDAVFIVFPLEGHLSDIYWIDILLCQSIQNVQDHFQKQFKDHEGLEPIQLYPLWVLFDNSWGILPMIDTEVSVFSQWGQKVSSKMVVNTSSVVNKAQMLKETDYQRQHTGK